jgi:hypothetical protein
MIKVLNFQQAIADSEQFSKRHLLLGNGFSIACRADIFHYESLFNEADFSGAPELESVFKALGTQDFEIAIRTLENGAKLLPIYSEHGTLAASQMLEHAGLLKDILLQTIAGNHPEGPFDIDDEKFLACRKFLNYFIGTNAPKACYVFTLNYDLLLYWSLMNKTVADHGIPVVLNRQDGFDNDEDNPEADYVVWQGETAAHKPNYYFLHGALHLFDSGSELQKYTWIRSGERLIEQARDAVSNNKFPLFVAEGTSKQKKNKIRHNAYLYQGYKVLTANAEQAKHCFFIFGHSLAENDDHILMRLARGKFGKLYIGLYGSPDSAANQTIITRASALTAMRKNSFPLELAFFDTQTANVWGNDA